MAVPAELEPNESTPLDPIEAVVVRALASGKSKASIARWVARKRGLKTNGLKALQRILQKQHVRDALWDEALIEIDSESGRIARGLVNKAAKGRVDAAKLAFELTGRYNPRPDAQVNVPVVVQFGADLPRPSNRHTLEGEAIDGEATEVEE